MLLSKLFTAVIIIRLSYTGMKNKNIYQRNNLLTEPQHFPEGGLSQLKQ